MPTKKRGPYRFHSKVAGVSHKNDNGSDRQKIIKAHCKPGMPLILKRERHNRYDRHAISIWIKTPSLLFFSSEAQIGYIKSDSSEELSYYMDKGQRVAATITEITGGEAGRPTRGVNIEVFVDQHLD